MTSSIIKGCSTHRPQTVHVVSWCGSGERKTQSERDRGGVRLLYSEQLKLMGGAKVQQNESEGQPGSAWEQAEFGQPH